MARTKSSNKWLQRHVIDPFVRKARAEGYRSRAAYKLIDVDKRERLLVAGAKVVDLGAAPGSWSQVAARKVGPAGRVVAVDLLEIEPLPGVRFFRGSFLEPGIQAEIRKELGGPADLVLSDMMPNVSGIASADQARAAELVLAAIEFCRASLKPGGAFLVKVFQGEEFAGVLKVMKLRFREVKTIKPSASREESRETYLLARGLRPNGFTPA